MVKCYPTRLWYLFNSELEIVARECVADEQKILATAVQEKVCSRLGERAYGSLSNFIEVTQIMKELDIMLGNSSTSSQPGKLSLWTNNLQRKVMTGSANVLISVEKSALQHTSEADDNSDVGRCQCGGLKLLKFTIRCGRNSEPSFFLGLF